MNGWQWARTSGIEGLPHLPRSLNDERKETAARFWQRAAAFFAQAGITVKAVMTDNGSCYRSKAFAVALGGVSNTAAPAPTGPRPTGKWRSSTAR